MTSRFPLPISLVNCHKFVLQIIRLYYISVFNTLSFICHWALFNLNPQKNAIEQMIHPFYDCVDL